MLGGGGVDGCSLVRSGKSERRAENSLWGWCERIDGWGVDTVAETPWIESWVRVSTRRQWVMSTRRLKRERKSAPRMGCSTSATMNTQRKMRCRPRLRDRERVP